MKSNVLQLDRGKENRITFFREVSIKIIKACVLQYRCLVNFEDIAMRRYNQERSSNEPR